MPRLLLAYLSKRILLTALAVQIALTIPVVLSALFHNLPPAALRGGLVWPALIGVLPTVAFIALPMAVGVAAALEYSRMASEGALAVLYSLKLSAWSVVKPALLAAGLGTALGFLISAWIAPAYVGAMHDVLNVIRHALNHRMLEPGRFYTFDEGKRTIYFERWDTPDIARNVFIRQYSDEKKSEETITAANAEFRRNDTGVVMILSRGSIQSRPDSGARVRVANFDEYAISLPMQGAKGLPPRAWKASFEFSTAELLRYYPAMRLTAQTHAEWLSEAVKRFVIPFLALAHTLLGVGLALTVGSATGRRSAAAGAVIAVLPMIHIGVLIAAETLIRVQPALASVVTGLVLAEAMLGAWLIQRQQRGGGRPRAGAPAR